MVIKWYHHAWNDEMRTTGQPHLSAIIRDAPIIGIGRLLYRYRPIVIYCVLWWHWILKLHFLIWTD